MLQLTQKLKDGAMRVLQVPIPALLPGHLLVRVQYSLISSGTECSTVKAARTGYLGKAKQRPEQVKQVLDLLLAQGPVQAYRTVMKKLDAYSPLGYSCAGDVVEVAGDVEGFKTGDPVACGGLTASHAEFVAVPKNLCVPLQRGTDLRAAAYNTLGAIALQGVRQADLRLGESCAVIGLGLLGQLTALLLKASGVRTLGIDIDPAMVELAAGHGVDLALAPDAACQGRVADFTAGLGCDAVIITAATDSLDPINLAGALARKRGTIVIVGAVPCGFDREPHFYKKELQLRMSCSYGPGRYDPVYEEKGVDYPSAYVRWTEKRNMQAFQELLQRKAVSLEHLTTHVFKLDDAPAAYDMVLRKAERHVGILIEYDAAREQARGPVVLHEAPPAPASAVASIGFIGAGSYAISHLLPNIPRHEGVALVGVYTASGTGARSVADRFGFRFCAGSESELLGSDAVNTVFIATRHDSHAHYVTEALRAGKHVFVEKPLCLTPAELDEIAAVYTAPPARPKSPLLAVGYNRRFAPLAQTLKQQFGNGPVSMIYRVNAGAIPPDSWIQDPETGGGRIIGEVCHFVDFLSFVSGSLPLSVYAVAMKSPHGLNDTLTVSLEYGNGSIGSICYFANGDKGVAKERVEVYGHGVIALLDDFHSLSVFRGGRHQTQKLLSQDKGQRNEVELFVTSVGSGKGSPISFAEIWSTSAATFAIVESLQKRQPVPVQGGAQ